MNEIIRSIRERRSVRQFTDQPVSKELLQQIVDAGIWAPTARNDQNWHFIVMNNDKEIKNLYTVMGKAFGKENYSFYGCKAYIVCTELLGSGLGLANIGCAMQNMMLAAHSLGLGGVWINQLNDVGEYPEVRKLLLSYGMPDSNRAWCGLAIGYPASVPADKQRKEGLVSWVE